MCLYPSTQITNTVVFSLPTSMSRPCIRFSHLFASHTTKRVHKGKKKKNHVSVTETQSKVHGQLSQSVCLSRTFVCFSHQKPFGVYGGPICLAPFTNVCPRARKSQIQWCFPSPPYCPPVFVSHTYSLLTPHKGYIKGKEKRPHVSVTETQSKDMSVSHPSPMSVPEHANHKYSGVSPLPRIVPLYSLLTPIRFSHHTKGT